MGFFGLWRRRHIDATLDTAENLSEKSSKGANMDDHSLHRKPERSLLIKSFHELVHEQAEPQSIHNMRSRKLVVFNEKVGTLQNRLWRQRRDQPNKSILKNSNRNLDEEIINTEKYMKLRDHYFDQVIVRSSYYGQINGYQHGGSETDLLRMKQLISRTEIAEGDGFASTILHMSAND